MLLHNDEKLLDEAIRATAHQLSLPVAYVEKDYWVTRALKALANSPLSEYVVFKGGTSLSKAYSLISRFSEDVDIAVLTEGLSKNQTKNRIKKVSKIVSSLYDEVESSDTSIHSTFRKNRFSYPRSDEAIIEGQITDSILLEVNAFADPEPHKAMAISSYISVFFRNSGQESLIVQYELESFEMNVLCTSRTVCEKIMGLVKASYSDKHVEKLKQKIRHIYDIHFLLSDDFTREFVISSQFQQMVRSVIACDRETFKTTPWFDEPLSKACIFSDFEEIWSLLDSTYNNEFKAMVIDKILPSKEMLHDSIQIVQQQLEIFDA